MSTGEEAVMSRMMLDCSTMPSETGCTLALRGEEDEVLRAAVAHAVDVHGHTDDDELRDALRASLVPEEAGLTLAPGAFVQVIEFRTGRIDEFEGIEDRWADEIGADRTARWEVTGADRNDPGRYLQVVAFPDHDSAMANSKHPATGRFAAILGELCDDPATFHDLDVRRVRVF
jgi:predicted small metal-binding protein